jgi:hypothetical protein
MVVKVEPKRPSHCKNINQYCKPLLFAVRANVNVQVLLEPYDVQFYIVKYITKEELASSAYKLLITSCLDNRDMTASKFLCKLINDTIANRDQSID